MHTVQSSKYSPDLRDHLMQLETSIRTQIATPSGGRVVTLGFPGLAFGVDGEAWIDPERMQATLGHGVLRGCDLLVVLVEPEELPDDGMDLLREAAEARGMQVLHLPIADYQAPGAQFETGWAAARARIEAILAGGGTLALSCHYGAGRSGMIAAGILMDQGMAVADAIGTLRAQFPDSIESDTQLNWLETRAGAGPSDPGAACP